MPRMLNRTFVSFSIATVFAVLVVGPSRLIAAEIMRVFIDKSVVLELERPASVVSIANPDIADVTVQSPKVIVVTGKSVGETSLHILNGRQKIVLTYDIIVAPVADDRVTVNLGADAVKTLNCQPRCIRVGNPGKDPEPGKGAGGAGGGGGAGGQAAGGGGLLSGIGGKK